MAKKVRLTNRDGMIIDPNGGLVATASLIRKRFFNHYQEKFFNKFLNKFEFSFLSYQQVAYIMRQFWGLGTVGCFLRDDWHLIKDDEDFKKHPEDQIVFAPWIWNDKINIYNFPNKVMFVNTKGVSFIPNTPFKLDKSAVIGYVMRNKKPVLSLIEAKLNQLVDIEMTIRTSLKAQKTPFFIACSPEDEKKMRTYMARIDNDEDVIFGGFDDLKNVKAVISGAPYVLDKLYQLKQAVENEILTLLGINNIGVLQKKEHLTTGEVEENDQQIQESADEFLSCLEEFFERVRDVLGINIQVKLKDELVIQEEPRQEPDKEDKENA